MPDALELEVIPLDRAVLCVDCESITATAYGCPVCGSRSLMSLARVLDRLETNIKSAEEN